MTEKKKSKSSHSWQKMFSICAATTFKNFLIVTLKAHHHSPQISGNSLSCGGADRRRKIGGLPVPVAAASQIVISWWQTAYH
jgi:hypothetical protein